MDTFLWSDLNKPLLLATVNMGCALAMGALIGSERQYRGRMAGLRTNALVALGAAAFVTFAALFPDDINPTRVAAQIVSGIGFLGAGIIFRDGMNVQGINTAATLWCSAAVGMIAGTGHLPYAIALTALIIFSNLGLRPLVRLLKKKSPHHGLDDAQADLSLRCRASDEGDVRARMIAVLKAHSLSLCSIEAEAADGTTDLIARISDMHSGPNDIEAALSEIAGDTRVIRASWRIAGDERVLAD